MAIKSRIQLKNDTEQNWGRAKNFVPLRGEVIIYLADDTHPFSRLKVGDGTTNVNNLPFINSSNTPQSDVVEVDITDNWNQRTDYIPSKGKIIIYLDKNKKIIDNETINVPAIKIGDGLAYLIDLPFIDDLFIDHINNINIHITEEKQAFWNNKINCNDEVINETLQLIR